MSTKQIEKSTIEIQIPDDVKVNLKGSMLHVQGPLGNVYKNFKKIPVLIEINDNKILLKKTGERKKHLAILNTSKSLIQTLCEGVVYGFTIKMKIVYSHFPITVKVEGKNVLIENFQGERAPRISPIKGANKSYCERRRCHNNWASFNRCFTNRCKYSIKIKGKK